MSHSGAEWMISTIPVCRAAQAEPVSFRADIFPLAVSRKRSAFQHWKDYTTPRELRRAKIRELEVVAVCANPITFVSFTVRGTMSFRVDAGDLKMINRHGGSYQ